MGMWEKATGLYQFQFPWMGSVEADVYSILRPLNQVMAALIPVSIGWKVVPNSACAFALA